MLLSCQTTQISALTYAEDILVRIHYHIVVVMTICSVSIMPSIADYETYGRTH